MASQMRFGFWFDEAKLVCEKDPDIFVLFNSTDTQFINYITYKMPIESRMSARSVLRYLYDSQCEPLSEELTKIVEEFRSWFEYMRVEQQSQIYKKLKMNGNSTYNRELEILARRWNKPWCKKDHQTIDADVKVTNTLCDKLRSIAKVTKHEETPTDT